MYFRMRSAVANVHCAPFCHRDQTWPLKPAEYCKTVAGLMPRRSAYAAISDMSCSMSGNVGCSTYKGKGFLTPFAK